jgi:hypothetical protein
MASFTSPLVKRKLPSDNVGLNGESYVFQYFVDVGMKFRCFSDIAMIIDTLLRVKLTNTLCTQNTTFDCF